MSIAVTHTLGHFPEGFCWLDPQQYGDALIAILTSTIPDLIGIIISDTEPAAGDRNKLWIKTSAGYPVGQFIYLSGWVWPHERPASGKERMIYVGTEAELTTYDGGSNVAVTTTTGPFWQRDTAFDFRMPLGMGTGPISTTVVDPTNTGGLEKVSLVKAEMPPHKHDVYTKNDDIAGYWSGDINGSGKVATGDSAVVTPGNVTALEPHFETDEIGGTTGTVEAHQNMPPYYGVIFCKRTARVYRTP